MLNQIKKKQKQKHTHTHTKESSIQVQSCDSHGNSRRWIIAELGPLEDSLSSVLSEHFSLTESESICQLRGARSPSALEGACLQGLHDFFCSTRGPNTKASPSVIYVMKRRREQQPAARVLNSAQEAGSEEWRRHDQKEGSRWSEGGWKSSPNTSFVFPVFEAQFLNSLQ